MTAPLTEVPATLAGDFPSASLPDWRRLIDKARNGGDFDQRVGARLEHHVGPDEFDELHLNSIVHHFFCRSNRPREC